MALPGNGIPRDHPRGHIYLDALLQRCEARREVDHGPIVILYFVAMNFGAELVLTAGRWDAFLLVEVLVPFGRVASAAASELRLMSNIYILSWIGPDHICYVSRGALKV